ncbi:MBL fold metallo-hydrolase [Radiobacillus kanasensis]|uniref:MBL fold metallo-hydrolase n=1 Tax=Radiobacillus kanasensis TaxID=2844358 RepID=UPI001E5B4ACB|nr:MBL fold metallo-hydrolase [Radiobacillus kanasensis]UFU00592.1 MBL fold metallo-hydrolase [Radiobacillus kanasensis]
MDMQQLHENCYCFHGPVNIGYVHQKSEGLLIDAGIDKSTMKKVIRQLEEKQLPVTHLFITHAHADHYGGAAYLQEKYEVFTIAPELEEAILRNPILEPIYLFSGNDPLPELRNKFLEGLPIRIDKVIREGNYTIGNFTFQTYLLPGHSYGQLAILINEILYAGDSYFSEEQLHKHKIPFLTDAFQLLESLQKLKKLDCIGAIPGHGIYEKDFHHTVQLNMDYHEGLLVWLENQIANEANGMSHEQIVSEMCSEYEIQAKQLSQWLLFRTAVTGYITALIRQGKITHEIQNNIWKFITKEKA